MMELRPSSRAAGFTLVELLVVLGIFAMMSLFIFDGFHFATRVTAGGNARLDRTQEIALATGYLRRQIADIRPYPLRADANAQDVVFSGVTGALAFIGPAPAYGSSGGFQEFRIAVEPAGATNRLAVRWQPVGQNNTDTAHPAQSVLIDDLATVGFSYFGSPTPREAASWHDNWNGAAGLPSLIRLRMIFRDGYAAPDLIVALHSQEPAFQ